MLRRLRTKKKELNLYLLYIHSQRFDLAYFYGLTVHRLLLKFSQCILTLDCLVPQWNVPFIYCVSHFCNRSCFCCRCTWSKWWSHNGINSLDYEVYLLQTQRSFGLPSGSPRGASQVEFHSFCFLTSCTEPNGMQCCLCTNLRHSFSPNLGTPVWVGGWLVEPECSKHQVNG